MLGMASISISVPKDLEYAANSLSKDELNEIVRSALKERLSEAFLFKIADELLKNSKMKSGLAKRFGDELKQRVAERHAA